MTFGSGSGLSAGMHPNRMKFRGVLVRLDEPSTKAPNGSRGHRILVPASVAKRQLHTLIGMGLNYAANLRQHDQQRKVGTITKAWIDGHDLHVEADVWKHDFPEAERDLKRPGLGMSMELGDIAVQDEHADIWTLTDFCFLGATILERTSAAYYRTNAIAASIAGRTRSVTMAKTVKKTVAVAGTGSQIARLAAEAAVGRLQPMLERHGLLMENFATRLDAMESSMVASGRIGDEDEDIDAEDADACDDKGMKAAKKQPPAEEDDETDDEDDDDDIESEAIDKGGLDEMGKGPSGDDDEPGHMNKGAKNKGNKSASENKTGPNVSEGVTGSARLDASLKREKALAAENRDLKAGLSNFEKKFKKLERTVSAHAGDQTRRSALVVSSDLSGFLAKGGINAQELQASGHKMTTSEVDAVMQAVESSSGQRLPVENRIETKIKLRAAGLMEDGAVQR